MAASQVAGGTDSSTFSGIRPVNIRTDLGAIAELIEICFSSVMDDNARAAIREKQLLGRSGPLLRLFGLGWLIGGLEQGIVRVEKGRLIGNVSITRADFPLTMGVGYAITNVAVHPDYRGRGIAQAMMMAALETIRRKGGHFAVLQVDFANEVARHVYDVVGFHTERVFIRWLRPAYLNPPRRLPGMPDITLRQANEWRDEYTLAKIVRPNTRGGMGWQRPTYPDLFRPSIWRTIGHTVSGHSEERWIIRLPFENGIAASLHAWRTFGGPNRMELLVHPRYQGKYETPLLNFALRRFENHHRPVQMEHPMDDEFVSALMPQLAFESRNTFANMRFDY